MKRINKLKLDQYKDHLAIFFTSNGILVNAENLPYQPFLHTVHTLEIKIDSIYLDDDVLIVITAADWQLPASLFVEYNSNAILGLLSPSLYPIVLRAIH